MKIKLLSLVFLCVYAFAKAQVGIGTTTPQATLDIPASDAVAPAAEDGILIPRIDNFPATNPTIAQDGMMVFVTGNGAPTKGFYYWDNTTTSWVIISGVTGGGVTLDQAYDFGGAGAGNTITATDGAVTVDGEDGLLVSGTFGSGATTGTNVAGTYMFFNPRKAAFRAGNVAGGNWADSNVGEYSIAMGRSVIAQGEGGIALGSQANASGENAVALGRLTTASGARATAFGFNNEASGLVSTAFGTQTEATGDGATSFGILTTASGELSTAFGRSSVASGENATAFGELTDATGENATAFGRSSNATGQESTAFGLGTNATGIRSTAFGLLTTASGFTSTAFGYSNTSPSQYETTLGAFATEYTPINPNSFEPNDRLFTIGNGELVSGVELRSNALTIYKSGLMNINDAYNMPLTDGTANQVMTTDGAGNVTFQDAGASGGTLDDAYDFGGAGSGNTITATDGAVTINGEDGLLITGTFGSGETITASGAGTRMFFNPRKAAFRAGTIIGAHWDNANIGNYSASFGRWSNAPGDYAASFGFDSFASGSASFSSGSEVIASGSASVAMGSNAIASGLVSTALGIDTRATGSRSTAFGIGSHSSGDNSTALGTYNTAPSFGETTLGIFATSYSPINSTDINLNDRLFTIGNGIDAATRSNALIIYKSGLMNINDAYNMPLTDGTANQVMTTDGAGNVTFQDAIAGTDDQQIDVLNLNGTNLEISLEDDGLATQTLDLASLQDGIGTDNQQIDVFNLNGTNLEISLEDDGVVTQTLDLSSLQVLAINDLTDGKTDTNNSSVYLGTGAGNNDNDALNFNTGIGANALTSSTSGVQNTAIGSNALLLNTTGSNNVAVGQVALLDNTTGSENIAIGRNAIANNIDGNQNIGIGGQSLLNNTSSSNNIAIGYNSLNDATTGRNIAIGTAAFSSLTTGTGNVGIGFNTQLTHTSGSNNVTLGDSTLDTMNSTTNASSNVAIGDSAMSNLTEGSNNVALGRQALFGNGNGAPNFANNNVAIGFQAGLNTEGNGNIFIGYQAGLLNPFSNNRLFIENSEANENDALIYGEFDNDILRTNAELQIGNPAGTGYAFPISDGTAGQVMTTDGAGNVSFQNAVVSPNTQNTLDQAYDEGGAGAGRIINVDNGAVQITGNAGGTTATTPAQLILTETQANDFSRLRFTNSVETTNTWTIAARTDNDATLSRMNFNHNGAGDLLQLWGDGFIEVNGVQEIDGRLGININNPGQALILPNTTDNTLGGTLARAWTTYSDGRVKSDQRGLVNGLSLLLQTTPKTYIHHDSSFENGSLELSENGAQTFGFIAQELYKVLPEAVDKPEDDTKELWSVDYDKIIPVAVKAIQELKAEKDALSEQVKKLEEKVQEYASLEARIKALEYQSIITLQKKSPNVQSKADD